MNVVSTSLAAAMRVPPVASCAYMLPDASRISSTLVDFDAIEVVALTVVVGLTVVVDFAVVVDLVVVCALTRTGKTVKTKRLARTVIRFTPLCYQKNSIVSVRINAT
jgi:hypothetical protein